ncbi:carbon-nitrogen hydrolase family protein [Solicola sp. PLA-1-18]|uniref:carbon-nitrogen hydrolase family protein n=1 Tax=Solicola sp. PLA-1-18 TaxID=3380532 RepID=UPI003B7AFE5D
MRIGAVAAHFGRDLDHACEKIARIVSDARGERLDVLVLPHATLGGYLTNLRQPDPSQMPPALDEDSPPVRQVVSLAGDMVVCLGYTEAGPRGRPYNSALCVTGDGVLGRHRKVHQPDGESRAYDAGDTVAAFETPVGTMGMLIDYDKSFPEAARSLALDGAELVACLSAWPASVTDRAETMSNDRQSRLFDLYDSARAAENQVVWVSSNQTGVMGDLRFLGQAKVVGPGGDVLAKTWAKGAMAVAEVDVAHEVARSRRVLHHLRERRPSAYPGLRGHDA